MSGSTTRGGGLNRFSAAIDSVTLCASVKARDDERQAADRAAEQQQADQEQEVVGTDQDVMDAGADEARADRQRAARRAGEVLERRCATPSRITCCRSADLS